ncbi:MAG: hypothetical protein J7L11_08140 [Thermoprotei archaeon]|nr:hypothetical protein [Thermoprotei archaeon]
MAMSKGQSSDDMMRPLQNEPDEEIEFIMRRKFLELQKKLLKSLTTREEEDPEKIVRRNLTKKAREVLDAALSQYPRITRRIIVALAQAIKRGEVETPIDAVTLYNTFKYLGIPVRLETKIRFYEKGRHIDLREKLKED